MFQDEHTNKITQSCRYNQVDCLADKDARCSDSDTDLIIKSFKDGMVSPASQPPCNKADKYARCQVCRYHMLECIKQISPDPVEHKSDDPDSEERGNKDCANFFVHVSATRDAGSMTPSQRHLLF
jgi:hypothetical protein